MRIDIFGKQDCAICNTTKRKLNHFLHKWGLAGKIELKWIDLDTVDGRAEGAFEDVMNVPTVIVRRDSSEIKRWDGEVPNSNELREIIDA